MISASIERCAGIDVGKKFFGRVCHGRAIRGGAPSGDLEVRYGPSGTGKVARLAEATNESRKW